MAFWADKAVGQASTVDTVETCSYRSCALTIVPTWNGLKVVRGTSGAAVANLNFFLPRDISHLLSADRRRPAGSDSVIIAARRAVSLRRFGAFFTDVGLIGMSVAGVRAISFGSNKRADAVIAAASLASIGIAVPFQFAADGALSQSVWWYNSRYAR